MPDNEYTPRCPSCYSDDLRPYRPMANIAWLIGNYQPYPGHVHCASCGKVSAPGQLVELRVLAATTRHNEFLALQWGTSELNKRSDIVYV